MPWRGVQTALRMNLRTSLVRSTTADGGDGTHRQGRRTSIGRRFSSGGSNGGRKVLSKNSTLLDHRIKEANKWLMETIFLSWHRHLQARVQRAVKSKSQVKCQVFLISTKIKNG